MGRFSYTHEIHGPINLRNYVNGIINTIIITDFAQQATLCNPGLTKQLAHHLAHHAGTTQNISQIVDSLKRHHITTSNKTVDFYLQFLQTSFIFIRAKNMIFPSPRQKHQHSLLSGRSQYSSGASHQKRMSFLNESLKISSLLTC